MSLSVWITSHLLSTNVAREHDDRNEEEDEKKGVNNEESSQKRINELMKQIKMDATK